MYRPAIIASTLITLLFLSLKNRTGNSPDVSSSVPTADEVIGCAPPSKYSDIFNDADRKMVPLPGWGKYKWKIETSSDSAQFYFNQGLNLFFSFHMDEARASFQEAQIHDEKCAMAYWGETMAAGPFINVPIYNFRDSACIAALEKAEALAKNNVEKEIIKAQRLRFTADKNADMKRLMSSYMEAMKVIYEQHQNDADIAILYADALMLVHPRDWYDSKGVEKTGTKEIIELLEQIIKQNPNHPAALHYYIHMVEPSSTPQRARDEADRLLMLLPSVSHMVHMPSHIYVRTGDYAKVILANKKAITGYGMYKQILGGWDGNRYVYLYHNADMQGTSAMMLGNYKEAKTSFQQNSDQFDERDTSLFSIPAFSSFSQFITAQPYLVDVRFGKWETILSQKKPRSDHAFHKILWLFGQGMALAKMGRIEDAVTSLKNMKALFNDSLLYTTRPNRNRGIDAANIAAMLLEGTILMEEKNWSKASEVFKVTVVAEDNLRYSEPEDWRIPARQFLGQCYLLSGYYVLAQKTFEEDLVRHPNNFWAINGLNEALKKQKKITASQSLVTRYKKVFAGADIKPFGAIF